MGVIALKKLSELLTTFESFVYCVCVCVFVCALCVLCVRACLFCALCALCPLVRVWAVDARVCMCMFLARTEQINY